MGDDAAELVQLLRNPAVVIPTTQELLALSAGDSGAAWILSQKSLVDQLIEVAIEAEVPPAAHRAALKLITNLLVVSTAFTEALRRRCGEPRFARALIINLIRGDEVPGLLLVNLTRESSGASAVFVASAADLSDALLDLATAVNTSATPTAMDLALSIIANWSALAPARVWLGKDDASRARRIASLLSRDREPARYSSASIVKNLAHSSASHLSLLEEELFVSLVTPLVGAEDLSEKEVNQLPVDLQYLDKIREPSARVRFALVQLLYQLLATHAGRERFRATNVYFLLREYHSWEKEERISDVMFEMMGILVSDEEDRQQNFHEIQVPAEIAAKFEAGEEVTSLKTVKTGATVPTVSAPENS